MQTPLSQFRGFTACRHLVFLVSAAEKDAGCQGHIRGGFLQEEGVQLSPHGGTEELLVSEHCLADCRVFSVFTVHCLLARRPLAPCRRRGEGGGGDVWSRTPPVQMAVLTAQKTAPLCHPLPPGAFAIFFNQPLHSGWVAAVCTVLAGSV